MDSVNIIVVNIEKNVKLGIKKWPVSLDILYNNSLLIHKYVPPLGVDFINMHEKWNAQSPNA